MINLSLWNIIFTVVNLLILLVAMKIFFFKPIKNIIEKRQEEANALFDKATAEEKDAESLKEDYEHKLEDAESEKKQILAEARKSAEEEHKRIVVSANDEARQIHEDATVAAQHEHDEMIDHAKKEIAEMVVEATTKVVAASSTDEINSELYDKFISEAGE